MRTLTLFLLAMLWPALAVAGPGPWVLAKGDQKLYAGMDVQRFSRLSVSSGSFSDDVIDVDDGVSGIGFKLIGTYGVVRGFEIEAEIPYQVNFTPRADGPVCELLGLGACQRTQGIGIIVLRTKGQLLDEVFGAPLSLALGLDLRFGQLTARHRQRITNLGEGTFDLEPRLSLGRSGALGKGGGYWSVAFDAGFRYRFPLRTTFGGADRRVPGSEVVSQFETLFTPRRVVSFGPALDVFWRPSGVDFEDTDLTDVDRFAALKAFRLSAGGKLIVRGSDRLDVSLSAFHSVYTINNPTNVFQVGAGVSFRGLFSKRRDG